MVKFAINRPEVIGWNAPKSASEPSKRVSESPKRGKGLKADMEKKDLLESSNDEGRTALFNSRDGQTKELPQPKPKEKEKENEKDTEEKGGKKALKKVKSMKAMAKRSQSSTPLPAPVDHKADTQMELRRDLDVC